MMKNLPLIAVSLLVIVGGLLYVGANSTKNGPMPSPTPSPMPSPTPSPVSEGKAPIAQVDTSAVATNSTAVVNGTVNPNGANTEFWYEYGQSSDLSSRTASYSIGSGFSPIRAPAYIEGLKATTTYSYRLVAKNSYGTSHSGTYSFNTTNVPPRAPGKSPSATTTEATNVERTIARVNGSVNSNGWATTYWFEYGTTANLGSVSSFQSAGEGTSLKSVGETLYNLSPLTKYYFRINAQNQYGTVNGDTFSFTTTGPLVPSKPTVYTDGTTGVSRDSATFKGRINPNASSTTYWFEYGTDTTLGNIISLVTPTEKAGDGATIIQVSAKVTGLASDRSYFYRLVARNSLGTTHGDIESFTTAK